MTGNPKELVKALDWGTLMLRRLVLQHAPEARYDAALITSAMTELIRGVEPPSVTGRPGRAKRSWKVISKPERRRLLLVYEYKKAVKKAPKSGKRKSWEVVPIEEYFSILGLAQQDEWADHVMGNEPNLDFLCDRWEQAVSGADLTHDEVRVLFLRIGLGLPLRQVAEGLDLRVSVVQKRFKTAMKKAQKWIESRGWDYETFMEG